MTKTRLSTKKLIRASQREQSGCVGSGFSRYPGRRLVVPALISSAIFGSALAQTDAAADRAKDESVTQVAQATGAAQSNPAAAAPRNVAQASPSDGSLASVAVTATRVKQLSQTVPVAITTMTGEALKDMGGATMVDLARLVPGLTVRDSGPVLQFNLRGAATIDNTGYHEGVVAVYNDDVYRASSQGVTGRLIDVERVEVLRGPQGLLFGRNTTGGVVHFISRQPTRDFEAYGNVGFGDYGRRVVEGAVSGPLTPTLAARVAILVDRDDGWQTNDLQQAKQPAPAGGRLNAIDSQGGRVSFLYTPNSRLTASVSGTRVQERNIFQGYTGVGAIDPARLNPKDLRNSRFNCPSRDQLWSGGCVIVLPRDNNYVSGPTIVDWKRVSVNLRPDQMPSNLDVTNLTGRVTYNLNPQWALTSITGFEDIKKLQTDEFDGTTYYANESIGGTKVKQFTQEVRVAGTFDNKSTLTLGLFYFDADWKANTVASSSVGFNRTRTNKSTAVFGQYAYPLAASVTGKLGLRWTADDKTVTGTTTGNTGTTFASVKDDFVTGQAGLEWNASRDQMWYLTAATAQKSGEFGSQTPPTPIGIFNPEKVTNFELGQKLDFWNRRARLNLAFYYNKTKDKQLTSAVLLTDGTPLADTFNIGDLTTKGADMEFLIKPTRELELGLNLAYTNSRLASPFVRQRTFAGTAFPLNGNRMVGTPEWQVGPSVRYTHAMGESGRIITAMNYKWQSKVFWDISNEPFSTEDPYGLLSGSVRWESADGKYHVRAWGSNLMDKQYANLRFALVNFAASQIQWGSPRRVGIEFGVKWF